MSLGWSDLDKINEVNGGYPTYTPPPTYQYNTSSVYKPFSSPLDKPSPFASSSEIKSWNESRPHYDTVIAAPAPTPIVTTPIKPWVSPSPIADFIFAPTNSSIWPPQSY